MDTSLRLYWAFLLCGVGQMFAFSAPIVAAAVIPIWMALALFVGWLPLLASAIALYRSRTAAWVAILGTSPALVMVAWEVIARECGYAMFLGVPSVLAAAFAAWRIRLGATIPRRAFQAGISSAKRTILTVVPLGLFLLAMSRLVLR